MRTLQDRCKGKYTLKSYNINQQNALLLKYYFNVYNVFYAHKTKYMTVSRDQNAGRIHSMKMDNSSVERVEEFKYLGTTLTSQNSIQEEIESRLKLGNACYYSVQNLLSSSCYPKL